MQTPSYRPSAEPLLAGSRGNDRVVALLERSCQDCHSSNTRWPFFARLFPISRVIANDVRESRAHMNLSGWELYSEEEKLRLLSEIGSVVRNRRSPPEGR